MNFLTWYLAASRSRFRPPRTLTLGVVHRIVQRGRHVRLRGMVIDDIWAKVGENFVQGFVSDVALVEGDRRVEIGAIAGGQVIDDGHLVAQRSKAVGDVRANESGSASHEDSHTRIIP